MADNQITTVRDMMEALQQEIEDTKTGVLPLETARAVAKLRSLQLTTAQLNLQYQRLNRNAQRKANGDRNILTGDIIVEQPKEPPK